MATFEDILVVRIVISFAEIFGNIAQWPAAVS